MPTIVVSDVGRVRILTLNRPQVRNALNRALRRELSQQLALASAAAGVRAVILTGAGGAFCAGLDLAELEGLLGQSSDRHRADAAALATLYTDIYRMAKPVIAAVDGPAVAGGAGLASVCDLVLATRGSRFGYSEARIGFVAALVGVFLVRQVGERRARELLLGAELVAADEAYRIGLVNEVVAHGTVLQRALERAELLCDNAPQALALTKRLLADTVWPDLDATLAAAAEVNVAARTSDDLREGVRAFLDKRRPRWQLHPAQHEESS